MGQDTITSQRVLRVLSGDTLEPRMAAVDEHPGTRLSHSPGSREDAERWGNQTILPLLGALLSLHGRLGSQGHCCSERPGLAVHAAYTRDTR